MAFFIRHTKLAKGLPDRLRRHAKARGTLVLKGIRVIANVPHPFFEINLARAAFTGRLRFNPPRPAGETGNPNRKSFARLGKTQPFSLPNRKNMATKFNSIGHAQNVTNLMSFGYSLANLRCQKSDILGLCRAYEQRGN